MFIDDDLIILKYLTQGDINRINRGFEDTREGFENIADAFKKINKFQIESYNYLLNRIRRIERECGVKHPECIIDDEMKMAIKKKGKKLTKREIDKIINQQNKKMKLL